MVPYITIIEYILYLLDNCGKELKIYEFFKPIFMKNSRGSVKKIYMI